MVLIIETLPSTQTNSVKEDGEIAQENYSPSEMFQDLKNQRTIFEPDASCSGKRLKANQPKIFSYPKKKFGKKERSFLPSWNNKWTCLPAFIKTGYSNWKHARSTDKSFHQHESLNCHQQANQRLIELQSQRKMFLE